MECLQILRTGSDAHVHTVGLSRNGTKKGSLRHKRSHAEVYNTLILQLIIALRGNLCVEQQSTRSLGISLHEYRLEIIAEGRAAELIHIRTRCGGCTLLGRKKGRRGKRWDRP